VKRPTRPGRKAMHVIRLEECEEFTSADNARLRELLHPDKAGLELRYSLAHAIVEPGLSTAEHRLTVSEVYYLLEGSGMVHIDGEEEKVSAGCAVYIPPGSVQKITNTGERDLVFLCIVDPAWHERYEEIL
jgi:mannose-6-phosphate isomerase-like protein (cupin superfamily)